MSDEEGQAEPGTSEEDYYDPYGYDDEFMADFFWDRNLANQFLY